MKPTLLAFSLLLSVAAPVAQASCHGCIEAVVEDCTAIAVDDCAGSATYLAQQLPGHAVELACEEARDRDVCP